MSNDDSNEDTTTATPHLWEVDHPYRCEDQNYLGKASNWGDVDQTWAEFVADGNDDWDPELNLVFRWDWRCLERERAEWDGDDPYWGAHDLLFLHIMLQRKGHYRTFRVRVEKSDEPAVREFLTKSWQAMRELWTPLAEASS
jgi:hypothetical protein